MDNYRYTLDNSRPTKSFICPSCGKKQLKRYVDSDLGEYLPSHVGRCNREVNCAYHYTPKQYFEDYGLKNDSRAFVLPKSIPTKPVSFLSVELLQKSIKGNAPNHFLVYLKAIFGKELAENLREKFKIGTSKYWIGATVFWQIDNFEKVRTGKVMLYSPEIGKRIKEPFNHIQWVHSILKLADFNLVQCLFGLHQLKNESIYKPIAIVESEKTAILMTVVLPDFIWLATGGKNLIIEQFKALKSRKITLFPDLNCFDAWQKKAVELREIGCIVNVSNILEENATDNDKKNGLDLADYFIKRDESGFAITENGYPFFWDR